MRVSPLSTGIDVNQALALVLIMLDVPGITSGSQNPLGAWGADGSFNGFNQPEETAPSNGNNVYVPVRYLLVHLSNSVTDRALEA